MRIYNLNPASRNNIRYDYTDLGLFKTVALQAGYGTALSTIFYGTITSGKSYRQGVEFISQIDAHDAGFAYINAQYEVPAYPAGTSYNVIVGAMVNALGDYGVQPGTISQYPQVTKTGTAETGRLCDLLTKYTGNQFFIDSGKAHAIPPAATITSGVTVNSISDSDGIIGTPYLENNFVTVDMQLEPAIVMGQMLTLNSTTLSPGFILTSSPQYKVIGVKHRGLISQTLCGDAITTLTLVGSGQIGILFPVTT